MSARSEPVLSAAELNRATLARQLLLERSGLTPVQAVSHLVGLQAQVPQNPYVALWSRLEGFRPDEVGDAILARELVRIVVMRGTIHLVTATDCLRLRPLTQPVLDSELARHSQFAPLLVGVDLGPVLDFIRPLLEAQPRTGGEIRSALATRFPDNDPAALAYAGRCLLPLVQVPPRGLWDTSGQVRVTTAESWLARPLDDASSADDLVLRYLSAFGPATVADVAYWSRLTGLGAVVDRLRPRLQTFRDERGRELFDVPEAPRPDADVAAPPRLLPEYDNLVLSHADRTRLIGPDMRRGFAEPPGRIMGSVLSDGWVRGVWRIDRDKQARTAALVISLVSRLRPPAYEALLAEACDFLSFHTPGADGRVQISQGDP